MIQCHIVGESAEIKVSGKDFYQDLERVKATFLTEDRLYDEDRKVWVIKNAGNYRHVNFINNAFISDEKQIPLF